MKTPVVWVAASLAAAIVTALFLIATGTRGDDTPPAPAERMLRMPTGK
jgi:hypothetical protein